MREKTAIFIKGKISVLRMGIGSMVKVYDIGEPFDKELREAIFALNRADRVLETIKDKIAAKEK